ncbi:hypothetical protein [Luteimicrobium subarcticum]|uniref:Cell division protein FtsL n=1 Tax=Luteimicrobium subarcticum TaxID=620910 RepID=A0A2M8WTX5_9MICO|nr:hypothetical protein [Luteimicrobium subarcticum]PJI94344.1 hypothetical protein CLV34_0180 [Luteimicrobium subarcticum]
MSTTDGATARVLRQFDPAGGQERSAAGASPAVANGPRLRVVRAPGADRSRAPFALLCGAVVLGALVLALLLNVQMAHGSFVSQQLEVDLARTAQDTQKLQSQVDAASSPAQLARSARELGMQPRSSQAFLRLADGKVLGATKPADG